ncbi:MAG: glycosyltransferase family 2 protein, partial [Bacteroidota bacterium]
GAVGGNVKVRNYKESLCARLQAIEYLKTISIGRIVTSQLGICRIISGAYGAFRRDILDTIGGWDIGPGLDGDITVKIRKCGYDIHFESRAICLTAAPTRLKALRKQRLRWDKSLIRFRIRKHRNVFFPMANFRWSNFFSASENIFYNLILDITWIVYMIDVLLNYTSHLLFIIPMNFTLYVVMNIAQMWCVLAVSERRREETELIRYLLLMPFYTGIYLRIIRSVAYFQELVFKRSYEDPWNPEKTSRMAKRYGL